jgi:hypothetical protein
MYAQFFRFVAAALNQHVENLALVIDGAPQVHPLAGDANDHLVEVPPVGRAWAAPSKPSDKPRTSKPIAAPFHRKPPGLRCSDHGQFD